MDGPPDTAIRELNLGAGHAGTTITDWISTVRILRMIATFFMFLRGNLALRHHSILPTARRPILAPSPPLPLSPGPSIERPPSPASASSGSVSSGSLVPNGGSNIGPSSSAGPVPTLVPTAAAPPPPPASARRDDVFALSLEYLSDQSDRLAALDLIADSIWEQRVMAATGLFRHPGCGGAIGTFVLLFWSTGSDCPGCGCFLAALLLMLAVSVISFTTRGYMVAARSLSPTWLQGPAEVGPEDMVLGMKAGREVVGALVLRLETGTGAGAGGGGGAGRRRGRGAHMRGGGAGGRGYIRAWTTRSDHRRRGIGTELLREAVRATREKCGRDAMVGFAKEHAYNVPMVPGPFYAVFQTRDQKAAKALMVAVADWQSTTRKKR